MRTFMPESDNIALEDGAWRLDPWRRVLVWVPAPPKIDGPIPVACRRCGALANQSCRSRNGSRAHSHKERHIPRQCACGAPVKPSRRLCEDCKLEANRLSTRKWTERRRTKAA